MPARASLAVSFAEIGLQGIRLAVVIASLALFGACESMQESMSGFFSATSIDAPLVPLAGSAATGLVKFASTKEGVAVTVQMSGLAPSQNYRVVVHATGNCTSPNGFSAGPPYLPTRAAERMTTQSGLASSAGTLTVVLRIPDLHLQGPDSIAGRSVIVHHGATGSLEAQPDVRNNRIACGIIGVAR